MRVPWDAHEVGEESALRQGAPPALEMVQDNIALTHPMVWGGGLPLCKNDLLVLSHAKS